MKESGLLINSTPSNDLLLFFFFFFFFWGGGEDIEEQSRDSVVSLLEAIDAS